MHRARLAALVALALLVAACGEATRILYRSADAPALLWTDRYLALEGRSQWAAARATIARLHGWHRRTELPRYAALLADAAGRMQRGLTRADVEWGLQAVRARYAALVDAAVREALPLIDAFDAENVAGLERRFALEDRKREREWLSGDPSRRERHRFARIVERLEEWTGPLSDAQQELVRRFVRATDDHPRQAHEARLRRQRELVALLDRAVQTEVEPPVDALRSLLTHWTAAAPAEQRAHDARLVELIVDLDRTLTAPQRASAVERLRRYAEDARVLAQSQ